MGSSQDAKRQVENASRKVTSKQKELYDKQKELDEANEDLRDANQKLGAAILDEQKEAMEKLHKEQEEARKAAAHKVP